MAPKVVAKSIRLSDQEARAVRAFVELTGEVEASVLKRAMRRGLRDPRVEQAIIAYPGRSSGEHPRLLRPAGRRGRRA